MPGVNVLVVVASLGHNVLAAVWLGAMAYSLVVVQPRAARLLAAPGVFGRVSWRLWPRRIFALAEEVPALQRSFRIAATALLALVVTQFVLGAVAVTLGGATVAS